MLKKILKGFLLGISYGCTVFVIVGMFFVSDGNEAAISSSEYIKYAFAAMIIGVGYTLPSEFLYDSEKLSLPLKVVIHLCIGTVIYMAVALWCGWIPFENGIWAVISTIFVAVISAVAIWFFFFIYHRNEAKRINEKIKSGQKN